MYSTLRPEGLASGSAKASVAMEANKIRADFMTTLRFDKFFLVSEKNGDFVVVFGSRDLPGMKTQVQLGKRTLLSFSNKSSHELTVRNEQRCQI